MVSDHPYAILGDAVTDADQRAAAAIFRDYLLSEPVQTLALQYGFRPALAKVAVTGGGIENPFNALSSYGARVDIGSQVETPPLEVTSALVKLWEEQIAPTLKPTR
jgi:ABC-type sulfate transport system substrate-binding protein